MKGQQLVAISGAALGIVVAIIVGIANEILFGLILLRALGSGVLGALLFLGASFLFKRFLPELLGPVAETSDLNQETDDAASRPGIDITLDEEEYRPDQAQELRAMRSQSRSVAEAGDESADMVEEVIEDAVVSSGVESIENFSEEAFYSGISELPDIGGFAENFSSGSGNSSGNNSGFSESDDEPVFGASSSIDRDIPMSSSKGKSNVDPKLMAQAISTALKKDNS